MNRSCLIGLLLVPGQFVSAGEADVLAAKVRCNDESICRFSVTVRHADAGWEDYANRWEILDTSGNVIGVRELAHPHEHEQPFTRSLGNVPVPVGISEVIIRARDSLHQYGGRELVVKVRE